MKCLEFWWRGKKAPDEMATEVNLRPAIIIRPNEGERPKTKYGLPKRCVEKHTQTIGGKIQPHRRDAKETKEGTVHDYKQRRGDLRKKGDGGGHEEEPKGLGGSCSRPTRKEGGTGKAGPHALERLMGREILEQRRRGGCIARPKEGNSCGVGRENSQARVGRKGKGEEGHGA